MTKLNGKICIITGGAKGIGKAVACKFLLEGAKVIIADNDYAEAQETCHELSSASNIIWPIETDVTHEGSVQDMTQAVLKKYGRIDVLVNNAGIQPPKQPFWEIEASTWDKTFDVNVKGIFLCTKTMVPTFIKQGAGNVINTSSVAGLFLWEGSAHYISTKGAVNALTKAMALELAPYKIRVNAVAPGHVDTVLNTELLADRDKRIKIEQSIPLQRVAIPQDIGGAFAFLASDKAEYITGHILYVDGGLTQIK